MTTSANAKKSSSPSFEVLVIEYFNDEVIQGQLFGAQEMDKELLVEAYLCLKGKRRAVALNFILEREDSSKLLNLILNRIGKKVLNYERLSDIRIRELQGKLSESALYPEIRLLLHFVRNTAHNNIKRLRREKIAAKNAAL